MSGVLFMQGCLAVIAAVGGAPPAPQRAAATTSHLTFRLPSIPSHSYHNRAREFQRTDKGADPRFKRVAHVAETAIASDREPHSRRASIVKRGSAGGPRPRLASLQQDAPRKPQPPNPQSAKIPFADPEKRIKLHPKPLPKAESQSTVPGASKELTPGVGKTFVPPPGIPPRPAAIGEGQEGRAEAAQRVPLSLNELEELTARSNPTLVMAQAAVQSTLGQAVQAGLWPNPRLVYQGMTLGSAGMPAGMFQGGLIRQTFVTARKLDLQRAAFMQRSRAAEFAALGQQWRVLNDVRIHYFMTLGQQELVRIRHELTENAEDGVVTAREAYNLGIVGRANVNEANVLVQQARLNLMMQENRYRAMFQKMTAHVGAELPLRPLAGTLEGDVTPIEWDQALHRLLMESPQVLEAYADLRSEEVNLKRQVVDKVPNLRLEAGAGQNSMAHSSAANVMALIEMPLFDWNQGNIRVAEGQLVRQRREIDRIKLMLKNELAGVYNEYLTALQHVQNYQQVILPQARERYASLLDAYENDRSQWFEVLAAQREYFMLRATYIEKLIEWRKSEVLIIGFLLHGGLAPPMRPMGPDFTRPLNSMF